MALHTFVAGDVLEAQQLNDSFAAVSGGFKLVQAETAFSAVASVTADNVFTSAYTNYRIAIRYQTSAGSLRLIFRASGVDTATNYNHQIFSSEIGTNSGNRQSNQTSGVAGPNTSGAFWSYSIVEITGVQLAAPTNYQSNIARSDAAYTAAGIYMTYGNQSDSTAFDGVKLSASTGTITGAYTIYGYGKA